ncbi:MAG TPA: hypothetical protein VF081_07975 [Solirubrobacterales bacterium]
MKLRLSPATALALIALMVSLGGTAFAAGVFTKKQKKQVTTIATKVFDSKIGGATVQRAETAGRADTVANAREAGKAAEALRVTEAARATQALRAPEVARADFATKAAEATRAKQVTTVPEAARASSAGDADGLDGRGAGSYQRQISGGCLSPSSIGSISGGGAVGCQLPIRPFRLVPRDGQRLGAGLGNGLELALTCGGNMRVDFVNAGAEAGNINFGIVNNSPGNGASSGITLDGARLNPGELKRFTVPTRVIQGQAVWTTSVGITTVIFHASDDNGNCPLDAIAMNAVG